MADSATPKGRATAEQMSQLREAFTRALTEPIGINSFRAAMLMIQTISMDGLGGALVIMADPRPGRPIDMAFTTSPAAVVIDQSSRKTLV